MYVLHRSQTQNIICVSFQDTNLHPGDRIWTPGPGTASAGAGGGGNSTGTCGGRCFPEAQAGSKSTGPSTDLQWVSYSNYFLCKFSQSTCLIDADSSNFTQENFASA